MKMQEEGKKTKPTQHTDQIQREQVGKASDLDPSGFKRSSRLDEQDDKHITKGEFRRGLENFEKNLDLKLKTFKAEITTVFTEKVAQVEERFFKYTFIAVGVILGGVGLMQYVANGNGSHQPIIIYTTPQQADASRQGATSYVIPGQAVDQERQNHALESIVTSFKQEDQPFNSNDKDSTKSEGKTN